MLSNFNPWVFLVLLVIAVLSAVVVGIVFLVRAIVLAVKSHNAEKLVHTVTSVVCILVAAASWILNPGWLRVFLTIVGVPIYYSIGFMIVIGLCSTYASRSTRLRTYIILLEILYVLTFLAFPDIGDYGPSYMFFGLIRSDSVVGVGFTVTYLAFAGSVIFAILQLVERSRVKKEIKNADE